MKTKILILIILLLSLTLVKAPSVLAQTTSFNGTLSSNGLITVQSGSTSYKIPVGITGFNTGDSFSGLKENVLVNEDGTERVDTWCFDFTVVTAMHDNAGHYSISITLRPCK